LTSFKDRLDAAQGFGPGFELTRLVLASGVVLWHALVITTSEPTAQSTPLWLFAWALVPMFFVLSGFLVAKSVLRLHPRDYLLNRAARIVPALAVDIVLCALVIGPLVTILPLADYVADPAFGRYFLNIFGWVHYFLPGVFLANRQAETVNGSLWTVPFELGCYTVLVGLMAIGVLHRARWTVLLAGGWLLVSWVLAHWHIEPVSGVLGRAERFLFLTQGSKLVPYFLAGATLYLGQSYIRFDWRIAATCVIVLLAVSLSIDGSYYWLHPVVALLACAPLAYLTIFCGLSRLPTPPSIAKGDYSYGIYLYHYPLLQLIDQWHRFDHWWQLLAVAALPVVGLAMFSWHLVERPTLALRRRFSLIGARVAAADPAADLVRS
jgi:peptidoglycan/LPS O-acetylase OafA/YrhL